MTTTLKSLVYVLFLLTSTVLTSCYTDDPGPIQEAERHYAVLDFDRLEMGNAFHVDVEEGNFFEVSVQGDRRNIEDLIVKKEGNTLAIGYREFRNRRYDTYITITMPALHAVNFSGGTESRISGFNNLEAFDVYLSGASVCQLDIDAENVEAVLSGASYLNLRGEGTRLKADISGASVLKAYNFPVTIAELSFSGASNGNVTVIDRLKVVASGGSHVAYRGQPEVIFEVSGSSSVHQD